MRIKYFLAAIFLSLFSVLAVAQPVNINTADVATLRTLENIGATRAAAIIEYRQINGSFNTVDEIVRVPGIGQAILSSIRHQITVGGSEPSATASPAMAPATSGY